MTFVAPLSSCKSYFCKFIKNFDVAGATHVNTQHTDARRFARLTHLLPLIV